MTIVGRWRNEYGSILDIRSHGEDGALSGAYMSHTGATGIYRMNGSACASSGAGNQALSICVFWRPTDNSDDDPSWNWVSMMSGVRYIDGSGAEPHRIEMLHALVVSSPVRSAQRLGAHVETLRFESVDRDAEVVLGIPADVADGPDPPVLRLTLTNRDTAAPIQKLSLVGSSDGRAGATIDHLHGSACGWGFIDPNPVGGQRSVALSFPIGAERSVTLGGLIDSERATAVLERFEANAVPFQSKYTAVTVGQETFSVRVES